MWSTKHHAPTVRRGRRGSTRRTGNPPTSTARPSITSTSQAAGSALAGAGGASSVETGPLMPPFYRGGPYGGAVVRSRTADAAGLAFHLLDAEPPPLAPAGDVLLLLHGGTETSAIWTDYLPAFVDAGWRVIAPDSRGHGATSNSDGKALTYELMAADMAAVMGALGIERVVAAGFSDGANIAFELARLAPHLTRGVVLHGLASAGATEVYKGAIEEVFHAPFGQPADLDAIAATSYGQRLVAWHAPQGPDGWRRLIRLVEPLFYAPPLFTQADLDGVRCPALVVTGDRDEFMPLAEHVRTAAALPDGELAVWPGVGHAFPGRTSLYTDLLLDFLDRRCRQTT